jgi:signal peptidase I
MAKKGSRKKKNETESKRSTRSAKGRPEEQSGLVEWAKALAGALVLFLFIRTFILQTFVITSGSMEETLLVGDFLVVNRLSLGARIPGTRKLLPGYSEPRRGDVIVFDPHHVEDLTLVKRLIGLPGDTLEMRDAVLFLNGEAQDEPYVRHESPDTDRYDPWMAWQVNDVLDTVDRSTYSPTRDSWGPLAVPDGEYFLMGDNRDSSLDSRYWGPLARWRMEGRAVLLYF